MQPGARAAPPMDLHLDLFTLVVYRGDDSLHQMRLS
jgi:hypothetical protein